MNWPFGRMSKRRQWERQIADVLERANNCARKMEASYARGEVEPRSEFDRLIEVRPLLLQLRQGCRP